MTNKEKARQIAWEYSKHYDPNVCKQEWVEMGAREMAEWKDKCFQTVIDGIKESYQLDSGAIFILDLIEHRYKDKFK